ncbi:MAG: hypothetical protein HQL50_09060 [Magnetococcales bacterium]|nr:hypothetical protein [Magnetococcales bacterium]
MITALFWYSVCTCVHERINDFKEHGPRIMLETTTTSPTLHAFDTLWEERNLNQMIDAYPPGFKEHVALLLADIIDSGNHPESEMAALIDEIATLCRTWQDDGYPDPSLMVHLLALRRFRPRAYGIYRLDHILSEESDGRLQENTFPLVLAVNEMLTGSPNPMRMRERLYDADDLIHDFSQTHKCRFLNPFDGRDIHNIYALTAHIDELVNAIDALESQ